MTTVPDKAKKNAPSSTKGHRERTRRRLLSGKDLSDGLLLLPQTAAEEAGRPAQGGVG